MIVQKTKKQKRDRKMIGEAEYTVKTAATDEINGG